MDGLRGREARFWLWVGRAVLLLTPAVVLALAIARLVSPPAAVSGSEELSWWELAVLGLVLAFAFGAPLILLPVTSATLTSSADCILEAQTVLGRRRLALASVTARSLEMQGGDPQLEGQHPARQVGRVADRHWIRAVGTRRRRTGAWQSRAPTALVRRVARHPWLDRYGCGHRLCSLASDHSVTRACGTSGRMTGLQQTTLPLLLRGFCSRRDPRPLIHL